MKYYIKQLFWFFQKGTQLEKDLKEKSEELADGFTMLAPTDDAFTKLDEEVTSKLLSDKKFADEVLRQHIIKGRSFLFLLFIYFFLSGVSDKKVCWFEYWFHICTLLLKHVI